MTEHSVGRQPLTPAKTAIRSASGCRWATPALFLGAPFWFDAEQYSWGCERDRAPRLLASTELCTTCQHWESKPDGTLAEGSE